MFSIDLICHGGSNIGSAIREAVHIANTANRCVSFKFNDERMCTTPTPEKDFEIKRLHAEYDRRIAYRASTS